MAEPNNPTRSEPPRRPAVASPSLWIGAIVGVALAVAVVAALRVKRTGDRASGLSAAADYQIDQYRKIDPALVRYQRALEFSSGLDRPAAVAVGTEDRIYVAGDRAVRMFDSAGAEMETWPLKGEPTCLAVGTADHATPGRLYVGMKDRIELFDRPGDPVAVWQVDGPRAHLTSIALGDNEVYAADAGGAAVLHYDTEGELLGTIGHPDKARGIPALAIPSPFFDVALGPDGHVWIVNPGALRLQAHTPEGNLELFWGQSGAAIEGFYGCCNPANFAILSDGRFVTAEKGLLRVKVYSPDGQFECVVAGPDDLETPVRAEGSRFDREHMAVDVAVDSRDRIVVLDLTGGMVQVYEPKPPAAEASDE